MIETLNDRMRLIFSKAQFSEDATTQGLVTNYLLRAVDSCTLLTRVLVEFRGKRPTDSWRDGVLTRMSDIIDSLLMVFELLEMEPADYEFLQEMVGEIGENCSDDAVLSIVFSSRSAADALLLYYEDPDLGEDPEDIAACLHEALSGVVNAASLVGITSEELICSRPTVKPA